MSRPRRPVVSALLLCDLIIREEGTHKASFIGLVHRIRVRRVPAILSDLWVYAMLTEGEGEHRLRFALVRLRDLAVMREIARLDVTMLSRDAVSELGFRPGSRAFTVVQSVEDS